VTLKAPLSLSLPSPQLARYQGGTEIYDRARASIDLMVCASENQTEPHSALLALDAEAAAGTPWLDASEVETDADPFPYLIAAPALAPAQADAFLHWLEATPDWHLNDGGFYAAFECDLARRKAPDRIANLFSPAALAALEEQATRMFGLPLVLSGAIAAHRMDVGQGIGVHTDTPRPEEETHRLVIILARNQDAAAGGHFVLLSGRRPASARRFIPLAHNTAIAFPLTEASFHAVTTLRSGCRFSIVFSFRPAS